MSFDRDEICEELLEELARHRDRIGFRRDLWDEIDSCSMRRQLGRDVTRCEVNQEWRTRRISERPPCPGCGAQPRGPKIRHGIIPRYCSKRCRNAHYARLRYQRLSPEAFAEAQRRRVARVRAVNMARWAIYRAMFAEGERDERRRMMNREKQRRWAKARRRASGDHS